MSKREADALWRQVYREKHSLNEEKGDREACRPTRGNRIMLRGEDRKAVCYA